MSVEVKKGKKGHESHFGMVEGGAIRLLREKKNRNGKLVSKSVGQYLKDLKDVRCCWV